jgi:hypothetical protein
MRIFGAPASFRDRRPDTRLGPPASRTPGPARRRNTPPLIAFDLRRVTDRPMIERDRAEFDTVLAGVHPDMGCNRVARLGVIDDRLRRLICFREENL